MTRVAPAGTARLQLQHKGDYDHTYTDLANILPCAGILGLPIISWLLDKKVNTPHSSLFPTALYPDGSTLSTTGWPLLSHALAQTGQHDSG